MTKTLSTEPLVHDSASVRDCKFGAYTEVGARTALLEVELDDYSYVVNDSDIAYADREILFDRGDDADQPGQSSDAPGEPGAFHLSGQRVFPRREG